MTHSGAIPDDPHLLLAESAWLRRLARGLCSDRDLADDLSQETLLVAWQARGRISGALRPWLTGVLRRLHANRRRAQARRLRREAVAAVRGGDPGDPADPADPATAAGTDEVLARAAAHRAVADAVMELDEPYRTAILLRYFEELPPRDVARRLCVPVETVRTRLKRGVALLRARLDATHGGRGAWLGAVTAFAAGGVDAGVGAAAGAGTLVMLGMVLMQTKIMVPLLAAFGLGAFYLFGGETPLPQAAGLEPGQAQAGSVQVDGDGVVVAVDAAPGDAKRVEVRVAAVASAATVVIGQLLQAWDGEPAVGIEVGLVRIEGGLRLLENGRLNPALAQAPRLVQGESDAAGRFHLEFGGERGGDPGGERGGDPGDEPHQVAVVATAPGCATLVSRMARVRPGARWDAGAARMFRSVQLHGRVRDTADRPVVGVVLRTYRWGPDAGLDPKARDAWSVSSQYWPRVETDPDGLFRVAVPVVEGTFWFMFDDPEVQLARPTQARLAITPDTGSVDLVVDRAIGRLRGRVLDHTGAGVAGLKVQTADGHCYSQMHTDARGAFELLRQRGAPGEVGLRVWWERFRNSEVLLDSSPQRFAWGRDDIELVLPRRVDLRLQVVQAPAMTPVTRFELDLRRVGAMSWVSGGVDRGSGTDKVHPGGELDLPAMVPGDYRVLVVEPDRSTEMGFTVLAGRDGTQRLVLPPAAKVTLEVVDEARHAVVGSRCDVFRLGDDARFNLELEPKMAVDQRGGARVLPYSGATHRFAGGQTDRDGRLRVRVPASGPLQVRVFGKGHAPKLYRDVLRADSGRVKLVVERGARLTGKLVPAATLLRMPRPALLLQSLADSRVVYPQRFSYLEPGAEGSTLQPDGSIAMPHVPAGDWQVFLVFTAQGRGGAGIPLIQPVGEVRGLQSGQTRRVKFDISRLAPVPVVGFALFSGAPARYARLDCRGPRVVGQPHYAALDCDADGRFAGAVVPGKYTVTAELRDPRTGVELEGEYPAQLVVEPGRPLQVTLDLVRAKAKQPR